MVPDVQNIKKGPGYQIWQPGKTFLCRPVHEAFFS
jgi:hypothetical protein